MHLHTRFLNHFAACILLHGSLFAQPKWIAPLGPPQSVQNISGPGMEKHILPGAPRLIASSFTMYSSASPRRIDSQVFFYDTDAAQLYDERLDFGLNNDTGTRLKSIIILEPATGRPLSWEVSGWDKRRETFSPKSKTTYIYDAHGRIVSALDQVWVAELGTYSNSELRTHTLNSDGYVMDKHYQWWSAIDGKWRETVRSIYTRNAQGSITSEETSYGADNKDAHVIRIEYRYDRSGLQLEGWSESSRNDPSQLWLPDHRATCTAHFSGRPSVCITETYFPTLKKWDTVGRVAYAYNAAGDETEMMIEHFNDRSHRFEALRKRETIYNAFNQLVSYGELIAKDGAWSKESSILEHRNYYESTPQARH